jgi:hypothetical protein
VEIGGGDHRNGLAAKAGTKRSILNVSALGNAPPGSALPLRRHSHRVARPNRVAQLHPSPFPPQTRSAPPAADRTARSRAMSGISTPSWAVKPNPSPLPTAPLSRRPPPPAQGFEAQACQGRRLAPAIKPLEAVLWRLAHPGQEQRIAGVAFGDALGREGEGGMDKRYLGFTNRCASGAHVCSADGPI